MKKRIYTTPRIRTEIIAIGMFGSYGDDEGGVSPPITMWNPFMGYCCDD